ncbi:MAG TPA: hypothetical protein PLW57_06710 [Sphaerochaeta sp.]|nr:hypothetical protein [Sphaerochaeta sp.]
MIHIVLRKGFPRIYFMDITICIMQSQIKKRVADQGRQPRHLLIFVAARIFFVPNILQRTFNEPMPYFHCVSAIRIRSPQFAKNPAKILQPILTVGIGKRAWPDPRYTQRGFTPSDCFSTTF